MKNVKGMLIAFRLEEDVAEALHLYAEEQNESRSQIIRRALMTLLEDKNKHL